MCLGFKCSWGQGFQSLTLLLFHLLSVVLINAESLFAHTLTHFYSGLAAGMGVGVATELARKALGLSTAKRSVPGLGEVGATVLSEANVERLVTTLCKMRGAALKLGQMISLQGAGLSKQESGLKRRRGKHHLFLL